MEETLEITQCFGIHCIANSRNLLEIKYSNKCSVQVVQKSVTVEEIGLQNFCVFLFWNTINPTHRFLGN